MLGSAWAGRAAVGVHVLGKFSGSSVSKIAQPLTLPTLGGDSSRSLDGRCTHRSPTTSSPATASAEDRRLWL